jgi:DNA-binding LacI/PurR family transcriptional regulator
VNLKRLAEHVGLTPGTVSAVLNNASYSKSIPQCTRDRIFAAAEELNYKPNFFARSLRVRKGSRLISVLTDNIRDARGAIVIAGIEESLREQDYFLVTGTHRQTVESLKQHSMALAQRGVEGFITINLDAPQVMLLPHVSIAIHNEVAAANEATVTTCFRNDGMDNPEDGMLVRSQLEDVARIAITKLLNQIAFEAGNSQFAKRAEAKNFIRYSAAANDHRVMAHALNAKTAEGD